MKIPERLIGFVDYEDTKYPFEFDADSFYLNLYPPTVEVWHGTSSIRGLIPLAGKQEKKHEWIGELRLEGFASDGKKVLFCLQANRSNYHGFYSYPVNWYFYYSAQMKTDNLFLKSGNKRTKCSRRKTKTSISLFVAAGLILTSSLSGDWY